MIHVAPNDEEIQDHVHMLFESADVDGDGEVSVDEFVNWASGHPWSASVLEHHEKRGKKSGAVKKNKPGKGRGTQGNGCGRGARGRGRGGRGGRGERGRGRGGDAKNGGHHGPMNAEKRKELQKRYGAKSTEENRRKGVKNQMSMSASSSFTKMQVKDMNKFDSVKLEKVASKMDMVDLSTKTELSIKELHELRSYFVDACDRKTLMRISKKRMREVLLGRFPNLEEGLILERLVSSFDANQDGTIEFEEFAKGMSRMANAENGNKLDFLFSIYDSSGDGGMDVRELTHMMSETKEDLGQVVTFAVNMISSLDHGNCAPLLIVSNVCVWPDGDGKVSEDEFVGTLTQEPLILSCFWQTLPPVNKQGIAGTKKLFEVMLDSKLDKVTITTMQGMVRLNP